MYCTVEDFIAEWTREAVLTQKVLNGLTDEGLLQQVSPEGRTLGRIAWHLVSNIPDFLTEFGVPVAKVQHPDGVPSAEAIAETFRTVSLQAADALREHWKDETLKQIQHAFGRMESNATILMGLIKHIVHHRGQLTILMRQAGLPIPAIYGPSKEGWMQMGMTPPL